MSFIKRKAPPIRGNIRNLVISYVLLKASSFLQYPHIREPMHRLKEMGAQNCSSKTSYIPELSRVEDLRASSNSLSLLVAIAASSVFL